MTSTVLELAERIKGETVDLENALNRALRAWQLANETAMDQDIYLDSVALNLHGFYSGLERFFELIGKHIDQNLPIGETWHRDLLERMAQDVTGVRPSVISQESERQLDSFRRFRHLVRNLYATNLVPEKMASLMDELPQLWPKLQKELLAFAKFLEYLAEEKD